MSSRVACMASIQCVLTHYTSTFINDVRSKMLLYVASTNMSPAMAECNVLTRTGDVARIEFKRMATIREKLK